LEGSKGMQRRQKTSKEGCPGSKAVKPQEYGEASSMHLAPAKTDHRERQYRLMEEILAKDNMVAALARVEANKGASGVGGMEVPDLRENLKREWQFTKSILASGTYMPMPVRQVNIPKPDGGVRTLGIPTVMDRMIQDLP